MQLFRYTRGGHGFGMGRPGTPTTAWPTAYAAWLKALDVHDGAKIVALPHDGATAAGRRRLFWRFLHNQTAGQNRFAQRRGGR